MLTKKNILFAVLSLSACQSEPTLSDSEKMSQHIDSIFAKYGEATPGCAVAVRSPELGHYAQGYGIADLEQGRTITPDSVFYAASVSKQVVAMSITLLHFDGRLDLDADVREHIPELNDFGATITLRQMLQHVSGMRDYFTLFSMRGEGSSTNFSNARILEMLSWQSGLNFQPGDEYAYSNSPYFLMSVIVERVTGKNLHAFAKERIFDPLNMTSTRFQHDHRDLITNKAHGYEMRKDGTLKTYDSNLDVVGSGGMYTSVNDLMKLDTNYLDNKLGYGQALVDEMKKSAILSDGTDTYYGLGLSVKPYRGLTTVRHAGSLVGYRAHHVRFEEHNTAVAILCNSNTAKPGDYANAIVDGLLGDSFTEEAPASVQNKEPEPALIDIDAEPYAGSYTGHDVRTEWHLTAKGSTLAVRISNNEDIARTFQATGEGEFSHEGSNSRLVFNKTGAKSNSFEYMGARVKHFMFTKIDK